MQSPTITLLTPRGRGAVATLRFEGPVETLAGFTAANGKPLGEQSLNRLVFGQWGREVPEDVVICRTAENVTEIHCHGGEAAAARIEADVESTGGRRETWPEMLQRTEGTFHREWTEAVSKATTKRTAGILLRQLKLFPQAIRELQSLIAETDEDFPAVLQRIENLLKWAQFGRHLVKPWEVVLGGPPNVGKSSLINALVGYARSIVYDQPGTTRDVVTAETAFEGWPIRLADTAGLREQAEALEAEGILRAKKKLAAADCQILLSDVSGPPSETDRQLREVFPSALLIAHKCDLPNRRPDDLPPEAISVSSLTGEGVDRLAENLIRRLIPQIPPTDQAVPFTHRQVELLEKARQTAQSKNAEAVQRLLQKLL